MGHHGNYWEHEGPTCGHTRIKGLGSKLPGGQAGYELAKLSCHEEIIVSATSQEDPKKYLKKICHSLNKFSKIKQPYGYNRHRIDMFDLHNLE